MFGFLVLIIILIIVLFVLISCVKIVPQAHAYVLERLGGYKETIMATRTKIGILK